jgi:hypothetical protein
MLAACLTLVACGAVSGEGDEPVELRTYAVPDEYRDELRDMLRGALAGDPPLGRVTDGPGGSLLVVAPARIQAGLENIVDDELDMPPTADPVTLTYWFLAGRPLDAPEGEQTFAVVDQKLMRLESVLTQIAASEGPTEFTLLDQVQATSTSRSASVRGRSSFVQQTATRRGDQIVARVEIMPAGGPDAAFQRNVFSSEVVLEPGQFLVLGYAGFDGVPHDAFPGAARDERLTLYYVMAADLD